MDKPDEGATKWVCILWLWNKLLRLINKYYGVGTVEPRLLNVSVDAIFGLRNVQTRANINRDCKEISGMEARFTAWVKKVFKILNSKL